MKRIATVKDLLCESLIHLMETIPYADITITDIANEAGVSRKSYYRNYESKEAILHTYLHGITKMHMDTLPALDEARTLSDIIISFLEHMKNHDKIARLLYNNNLFYLLETHIRDAFSERFSNTVSEDIIYFLSGACFHLYLFWFQSDYKLSAAELAGNINMFLQTKI